jgi:hypothetical protein
MSNVKVVSTASANVTESKAIIISIVEGEVKVNQGYTALAMILIDQLHDAEIKAGLTFERISRASSGAFADAVNAVRDTYEGMFKDAGHKQPRGAWGKIKDAAEAIRNGDTQKPESGTRSFKPADEFAIERLISVYNRAIKTAGEITQVDEMRPIVLKALNKLGVSSNDKRLKQ